MPQQFIGSKASRSHRRAYLTAALAWVVLGCGTSSTDPSQDGHAGGSKAGEAGAAGMQTVGGRANNGGNSASPSLGGAPVGNGGVVNAGGSGISAGGAPIGAAGNSQSTPVGVGGASSGGNANGGVTAGGVGGSGATGGKVTTGGKTATGGNTATGGKTATGGNTATGGKTATGGTTATGGKTATGGTTATGGKTAAGGTTATGGTTAPGGAPGCPTSSAYIGDPDWPYKITATKAGAYCGLPNENRSIEQEYNAKAKVRIAEGSYPIPDTTGKKTFALPVCFERRGSQATPAFDGAGSITYSQTKIDGELHHRYIVVQALSSDPGSASFRGTLMEVTALDANPSGFLLNGASPDPNKNTTISMQLCQGTSCTGAWNDVAFISCNPQGGYRHKRTSVTFDGGQVTFDLWIETAAAGGISAGTEPSMLVEAKGSLDDVAFDQTDYWKLIYNPEHHHTDGSFAVLFDTPVGKICGLKILNALDSAARKLTTVRCDLADLDPRAITKVEDVAL